MKVLLLMASTVVLTACKSGIITCPPVAYESLTVLVTDSLTGHGGPFTNLDIVARNGTFVDSAFLAAVPNQSAPMEVALASEYAGSLDVTVRADGYRTWTRPGVTIERSSCNVIPVTIATRLVRQ